MNKKCKASVGGQAIIEGVMMKNDKVMTTAVRTPSGEILIKKDTVKPKSPIQKYPIIRGVVNFVESMVTGIKILMYSAEFWEDEEEEAGKKKSKMDQFLEDNMITVSLILSLFFSVGLFMLLPTAIVNFAVRFTEVPIILNLIEGVVRIAIFVIYTLAVSRMNDIKRVFQYHGAEHKSIFCYEEGLELTVENVRKQGRLHPRCGTSFIFIVMIVSILLFSCFKWPSIWIRLITRLALLPVVAGIAYELIKWAGRSDSMLSKILSWPGMQIQKITTAEPDDAQIEVAIAALKGCLDEDV